MAKIKEALIEMSDDIDAAMHSSDAARAMWDKLCEYMDDSDGYVPVNVAADWLSNGDVWSLLTSTIRNFAERARWFDLVAYAVVELYESQFAY